MTVSSVHVSKKSGKHCLNNRCEIKIISSKLAWLLWLTNYVIQFTTFLGALRISSNVHLVPPLSEVLSVLKYSGVQLVPHSSSDLERKLRACLRARRRMLHLWTPWIPAGGQEYVPYPHLSLLLFSSWVPVSPNIYNHRSPSVNVKLLVTFLGKILMTSIKTLPGKKARIQQPSSGLIQSTACMFNKKAWFKKKKRINQENE